MSSSSSPMPVPPGQYPPFAVVTESDHTAWIIIATALGLSCILLFSVIKLFIRWTISRTVGLDEACLSVSTVVALIQSSIVLGACSNGLGKSIELLSDSSSLKVQQMYYASLIFFVVSVGFSKLSVAFLLLCLTPYEEQRRAFYIVVGLIAAWTFASTFAVALQCNLSHPWILVQESCPRAFLRWQLISAFDIIFELCLVGMSFAIVWGLQTSFETKSTVVFAFGMRLPLLICIAFRLGNFNTEGLTTNPTLLQDKFIIWTQTEMVYSVIAATLPSIRPFIKTLSTNYGTVPASRYGTAYGDEDGTTQSGSYQLSSLRPKGKGDEYKYRIWAAKNGVDMRGAGATADAGSVKSHDSRRMIIKKDIGWEIATDST